MRQMFAGNVERRFDLDEVAEAVVAALAEQHAMGESTAIAMRPEAILLDEIASALDPELVAEVLNIVRDLARDGMTMMLATHEMQFAREVSDLVVFLEQGRLLEQGPPEQIFANPKEERTSEFLKQIVKAGRL